jgi:hypothetical protein
MFVRRLRAKPEKTIVDGLGGDPQFVKNTLHAGPQGLIVPVEPLFRSAVCDKA